jgi:hypothetical protein
MLSRYLLTSLCLFLAINCQTVSNAETPSNLATGATVTASSVLSASYPAAYAIDGTISDASRWLSADVSTTKWLKIEMSESQSIAGYTIYSGYQNGDPINQVYAERLTDGVWELIPGSQVTGNYEQARVVYFDETIDAASLRFVFEEDGIVRIREIIIWSPEEAPQEVLYAPENGDTPFIFVNQSGYNLDAPKRFNAQGVTEDAAFTIETAGGVPVYAGTLDGLLGDFSDFNPSTELEFVIKIGDIHSDRFQIGPWWLERVTYQNSLDFMIEARHYVGNDSSVVEESYGWRDDHFFAFELSSLVAQYLSNPASYERMPQQITYEAPSEDVDDDTAGKWGTLTPYPTDAPDIVKLIHWGADVIVTQGSTHEMLKSELASFLYAWPLLSEWLDPQNYDVVKAYALAHWADTSADRTYRYDESATDGHNLYDLKTTVGTTKGAYPPGFSVLPNALMAVVMERDGSATEAAAFRTAATNQVQWLINNLDLEDPQSTKGQRMSENLLIMGLAGYARLNPSSLPTGFDAFISEWASIAIERSANDWDFRRLSDDDWTPTDWNEPGNVAGFPAAALEAANLVSDSTQAARLRAISWAAFDNMFGRNPTGRHFSYDAPTEIEGVERGWYSYHTNGVGKLTGVPFVLDGAPKNEHYPNHPEEGDIGWTEGWINFNTAYNRALAVLAYDTTDIQIDQLGDSFRVRLTAPLHFESSDSESVSLEITTSNDDSETITLSPLGSYSKILEGSISAADTSTPSPDNDTLELSSGDTVYCSYGSGYYQRSAELVATTIAPRDSDLDGLEDQWERDNFSGQLDVVSADTAAPGDSLNPFLALTMGLDPSASGSAIQVGSLTEDSTGQWIEIKWSESLRFPEDNLTQLYSSEDLITWEAVTFDEIDAKLQSDGLSDDGLTQYLNGRIRIEESSTERFFRISAPSIVW